MARAAQEDLHIKAWLIFPAPGNLRCPRTGDLHSIKDLLDQKSSLRLRDTSLPFFLSPPGACGNCSLMEDEAKVIRRLMLAQLNSREAQEVFDRIGLPTGRYPIIALKETEPTPEEWAELIARARRARRRKKRTKKVPISQE